MSLSNLITDRTQSDVARWKALHDKGFAAMSEAERQEWLSPTKGSYNYTDLNRVETAVAYVAERLYSFGYPVDVVVKTNWTMQDVPTVNDMRRYFENVNTLRGMIRVYSTTPEAPTTEARMDYKMANNLEKILLDVDELLTKISGAWFYSGDLYLGEV